MLEKIAEALNQKDYKTAAQLLKQLKQDEPNNPWLNLYLARFFEETDQLEKSEQVYRKILRDSTNVKLMSQARQGLSRLEKLAKEKKQEAIATFLNQPESQELGVLIIEALPLELKQKVAPKFGEIMQLDPYIALLQLPSRSWRLYRTGAIGELNYYTELLKQAEIPSFSRPVKQVNQLEVYRVNYIQSLTPEVTVICQNQDSQEGSFTFQWSEVKQLVEGILPIYEESFQIDSKRKIQQKTKLQDYTQLYDLHFPERNSILRFCDQTYEFQDGILLLNEENTTIRQKWNSLLQIFQDNLLDIQTWSEFSPFGETAIEFPEMLKNIKSHINFLRHKETSWDPAFQLYSGLAFLRNFPSKKSGI
jgi:hypothetical protein